MDAIEGITLAKVVREQRVKLLRQEEDRVGRLVFELVAREARLHREIVRLNADLRDTKESLRRIQEGSWSDLEWKTDTSEQG